MLKKKPRSKKLACPSAKAVSRTSKNVNDANAESPKKKNKK
jgi:hypothetical protein